MKPLQLLTLIILLIITSCENTEEQTETTQNESDYQLVWSDEFDKDGMPDTTKWTYAIGDGCPELCGWGNGEKQYYTNQKENARVENGVLIIEARKETVDSSDYTSAKLETKGKQDWLYGKFETRAKLQGGTGTWSALWMLPSENKYGYWPKSGEIDIMEHVGHESDWVFGTIHTEAYNHWKNTHIGDSIAVKDSETEFHVYGLEWTPDSLKWSVDNEVYFALGNPNQTSAEWPYDQRFYFIMNIAIGGFWGEMYGIDDAAFPQRMEVDYVRVYQKDKL
jgi:beta-glucanase (GH16 family)